MDKIWQVMPKVKNDLIKRFPKYNQIILQLLYNRRLKEKKEIENFLYPDLDNDLNSPFLFNAMEAATELVIKHIKEQNKIIVYGDYDADGVTAAVALYETLDILHGQVDIYIPDRVSEGYGLNRKVVKELFEKGTKLIITVDVGIRNKEEVDYAKKFGIDIVITDHHIAPEKKEELPKCLIIDSMVLGERYPFKYLSGIGVSLKLAMAVIEKSTLSKNAKLRLIEKIFDLVPIGTVADCVSLLGENRVLVKRGLQALNNTSRLGLKKLIEFAQINTDQGINTWNIGFQIAPRLNAAGRMGHANTAFELLITKEEQEAEILARRLNEKNLERQRITDKIVEEVTRQINKNDKIIIGLCPSIAEKESWHEGVIGLVAGKICEKYYRPTLVITKSGGCYKGSGRSINELNIIEVIERAGDWLERYGGHAGACGFSLNKKNLDNFIKFVKKEVSIKLKDTDLTPRLNIDAEIELEQIDEDLVEDINRLEPFGQSNERPKFVSKNIFIVDIINMGINGQHIKVKIKSWDSTMFNAIGFGQAEQWQDLKIDDAIDIVYYLEFNEFNGKKEIQLKIIDIKKHEKR
jgi:single-stranded-DNA-specific exonuclease